MLLGMESTWVSVVLAIPLPTLIRLGAIITSVISLPAAASHRETIDVVELIFSVQKWGFVVRCSLINFYSMNGVPHMSTMVYIAPRDNPVCVSSAGGETSVRQHHDSLGRDDPLTFNWSLWTPNGVSPCQVPLPLPPTLPARAAAWRAGATATQAAR